MKIAFVLGTRPEIIKTAPVIKECEARAIPYTVIHTGQHYDYRMDKVFFSELELHPESRNLCINSGTHVETIAGIMLKLEKTLKDEKPDVVLVQGDTNSVLAGALTTKKLFSLNPAIKLGHIEAGLRSYDLEMPEEYNRILCDHLSDYLFVPTKQSLKNLRKENISSDKIFLTGNTIVDAVYNNLQLASEKSTAMKKLNLKHGGYMLLTAHRQENVDNKEKLSSLFDGLGILSKKYGIPIVYPIHPRTKKRISEFGLSAKVKSIANLVMIEPIGYFDFLWMQKNAALVITDSGGVQEESCILGTPCITIRENTERPETIEVKANILVGCDAKKIVEGAEKMIFKKISPKNPFGDGKAAKKIVDALI